MKIDFLEHVSNVQNERQKILQNACKVINNRDPPSGKTKKCDRTLVDVSRKISYCLINKVSSSSMKKALVNSSLNATENVPAKMSINNNNFLRKYGLEVKCLTNISKDHIDEYFKYIIVRHPLKRLLSCYMDKFLSYHHDNVFYWQKILGVNIIKKYRKDPTQQELKTGRFVTFEEFLRHVIDTRKSPNSHWR